MLNFLELTDGYKLDHRRQYPPGTTRVYSNFTPRASRIGGQEYVVFFGLQYAWARLQEIARETFFRRAEQEVCDEYRTLVRGYLGPEAADAIGTDHVRALHKLGYIPLEFNALPEGSLVPLRVPMFTVENTHDDFFWVVNYFETYLSNTIWPMCTSATTAHRYRLLFDKCAAKTGGDSEFVPWQGHDFSMRGMMGCEAAAMSGAGHLLSFTGTDTLPAMRLLEKYYNGNGLIGGSVAATEHSVMCAGGKEDEQGTFERLLALYPTGVVSVVSDTWDFWNVVTETLPALKDRIMARNGKLVIRPDSGDPVRILTGDNVYQYTGDPRGRGLIECLWDIFGGTVNQQGYKVLDPHIGAIYGDSITYDRASEILGRLEVKGFASTNVVLGIGSYTYQYTTRDTYGFAMKATWVRVNGEERMLFKEPKTDDGTKKSARGRLVVFKTHMGYRLQGCLTQHQQEEWALHDQFGKYNNSLNLIRKRLGYERTKDSSSGGKK